MSRYYYQKASKSNLRQAVRYVAMSISLLSFVGIVYTFLPLLSWQVYFAPLQNDVASPIPKTTIVSQFTIKSLIAQATAQINNVDYTNAQNWFPELKVEPIAAPKTIAYALSVSSLHIEEAIVSTTDYDLAKHLVNYPGTAIPPKKGNAVIFGHSTLPQLFNPNDYKTLFANLYKLKVGDEIFATVDTVTYTYKISSIAVVPATDMSMFTQTYDHSYLTLVTCTPPGTTWKRLVVKARMEEI